MIQPDTVRSIMYWLLHLHHICPYLLITGFCKLQRTSIVDYPNDASLYIYPPFSSILSITWNLNKLRYTYGIGNLNLILNLSAKTKTSIEILYDQISNITIVYFKMKSFRRKKQKVFIRVWIISHGGYPSSEWLLNRSPYLNKPEWSSGPDVWGWFLR